jgi:hypothetical protein
VPRLPVIAELGDRPTLAVRDEDRVKAESARASRLVDDLAGQDAGAAHLLAIRRKGDQLADVAGTPAFSLDAFELGEQTLVGLPAREAR